MRRRVYDEVCDVEVRTDVRGITGEEATAIREKRAPREELREPERCPECGRATEIIIRMRGLPQKSTGRG